MYILLGNAGFRQETRFCNQSISFRFNVSMLNISYITHEHRNSQRQTGLYIYPDIFIFAGIQEYCYGETFEAKCKEDEVIVMKSASYGRMTLGRCVRKDLGYVGCRENVTNLVNKHCSGRSECRLEVMPTQFEGIESCPDELISYLQIEYICMKSKFWFNLVLRNFWKVSNVFSISNILFMCSMVYDGKTFPNQENLLG